MREDFRYILKFVAVDGLSPLFEPKYIVESKSWAQHIPIFHDDKAVL